MIQLYEGQKTAVKKLRSGSILCGGVGTGKSITALAYYFWKVGNGHVPHLNGNYFHSMENHVDLHVITTAMKRDSGEWDKELSRFRLHVGENNGTHIFVDSWNNIKKYENVSNAFFIFDEQRLVGYGTWVKAFLKIAKRNRWILLSATPGDTWMDYMPVFVANGFYRNKTDFTRQHVVYSRFSRYPKIERYVDTDILEDIRKELLVTIPMEKKATRHSTEIKIGYDDELYSDAAKRHWDPYQQGPCQDAGALCYILRRIVNEDNRRIDALAHLLYKHPRCIVFYNFDYELGMLRSFCESANYSFAEWNGHKHEPIPKTSAWLYLVQYTAGAEGWNCTKTDTIVFFSQSYSYRATQQAMGRIDRLNTPYSDLYYYTLISDAPIDKAIKGCLRRKKNFNIRTFVGMQKNHVV